MARHRISNPRTSLERSAARRARHLRLAIGSDLRVAREDAGLSLSRLAEAAGLSESHLYAIEAGSKEARTALLARVACVLGMDLSERLYPGTGPLIHDHLQSAMISALLEMLHERWRPTPEVDVQRPVRGVIDLVLDAHDEPLITCEAHSELPDWSSRSDGPATRRAHCPKRAAGIHPACCYCGRRHALGRS